jgi:intracellular sulfur oxidation DsrE/DsrF family protein
MLRSSTILFLLFISFQVRAQVVSEEPHRIIFQLTDGDSITHFKFIRQINNILAAAPNAQVEVVTHGMGIDLLKIKNNPLENSLKDLKARGVEFVICENTLKQRNMKKEQFLPLSGFVPSAVLELVIKQEKGWIYIKAGG